MSAVWLKSNVDIFAGQISNTDYHWKARDVEALHKFQEKDLVPVMPNVEMGRELGALKLRQRPKIEVNMEIGMEVGTDGGVERGPGSAEGGTEDSTEGKKEGRVEVTAMVGMVVGTMVGPEVGAIVSPGVGQEIVLDNRTNISANREDHAVAGPAAGTEAGDIIGPVVGLVLAAQHG